ncbi:hypothetical protein KC328_g17044 [Hortaea werneckii]|nr:hypothetical protein KC328_g17044 [Hortaea werneckii]
MHTTLLFTIASTLLGLSAAKDVTLLEAKCQQICCDDNISGSEKFCELALGFFCSCSADLKRDDWSWKSPQTVTVTPEWCIAPKPTTSCSTTTETFSVTTTRSSMTPPKPTTSCIYYQELYAAATALNQLQHNDNDVFYSGHDEDDDVNEAYHELQHDYEDHHATGAFFSVYQDNLQPARVALFHQLQHLYVDCVNDADDVCGLQGLHDLDQAVVPDHEHYGHDHEQWHLQPHEEHFHWRGAGDDY